MRGKFLHPIGKCLIIYIITQYWTTFEMQKMPVFTKIFNYLAVINFYFIKYSFPYLGFISTAFWFLFLNIKFSTIWLILVLVFYKSSFLNFSFNIITFISKIPNKKIFNYLAVFNLGFQQIFFSYLWFQQFKFQLKNSQHINFQLFGCFFLLLSTFFCQSKPIFNK